MKRSFSNGSLIAGICAVAALWLAAPGADAEDAAPAAGSAPLATEEHSSGAEVTLLEVKRTTGDTVTVKWAFRNPSEEKLRVESLISENDYLVDGAAKKKYFIVKDTERNWVALQVPYNHVEIDPGKKFKVWAKFPAPPAATEKVTVYLDGVPPMEDVPIAK